MAMSVGGPKGGPMCELNITPLIDVLLVLIIIFMILSTQVKSTGLEALAPHPAEAGSNIEPERTVVVQLVDSGADRPNLLINRQPVTWEGLRARLIDIYKLRAERVLFVQAEPEARFEYVAQVIDTAKGDFRDMQVGLLRAEPRLMAAGR